MCFSTEIEPNLEVLSKIFDARVDKKFYAQFNQYREKFPRNFKTPGADNRIFPNVFAPIIFSSDGERVIRPMRYRIRPHKSTGEVPAKFNLYNARLDSLSVKNTWKNLVGRQHGLFPFVRFYEWVEKTNGRKSMVAFNPSDREIMWAPCLYDHWTHPKGEYEFFSFALITTDPPMEVENAGHDRCPVFLKESAIEGWLEGGENSLALLQEQEDVYYFHQFVQKNKKKEEAGQLKLL